MSILPKMEVHIGYLFLVNLYMLLLYSYFFAFVVNKSLSIVPPMHGNTDPVTILMCSLCSRPTSVVLNLLLPCYNDNCLYL